MTRSTDQALLELVRAGDERAFEKLVMRYRRPLRSYCRRLGVPAQGAEDVIQQALLEAWIALRGGAQVHAFKAWLYRIVHNIALDSIRETPRGLELASGEAEHACASWPAQEPGLREALTAVAALPLLQREAIVRTALVGESHEQVGRHLGVTTGAVKGLIYRGRATLRSALAALVPPWLPRLIASRSGSAGGLRESLSGMASSAAGAGSAGALVKAGAIFAVAATAITATLPSARVAHPGSNRGARGAVPGATVHGEDLARKAGGVLRLSQANGDPPRAHRAARSRAQTTRPRTAGASAGLSPASGRSDADRPQSDVTDPQQQQQQQQKQADAPSAQPQSTGTAAEPSPTSAAGSSATPSEASPGSGTPAAATGSSESTASGEQAASTSGASGGPVGELVHTVEKTLETTVEATLGGLLHH